MKLRWLLLVLFVTLLSGCVSLAMPGGPSPYPSEYLPTVLALTVQAGYSPTPTLTATTAKADTPPPASPSAQAMVSPRPTRSPTRLPSPSPLATSPRPTPSPTATRRPSKTPTITPTPTLALAAIQILEPGPASRLPSPIQLKAMLQPGARGIVLIELLGEKANSPPLYRATVNLGTTEGRIYLEREIDFEISGVSQLGRLQLTTQDAYGRLIALSSVDLILLSIGEADITPAGDLLDPIIIRQPLSNALIQGGVVTVMGIARPASERLFVELVDSARNVVGSRQVAVAPSPDGSHVPFVIEVPYTVTKATWVRIIVREQSTGRIPGTIRASSVEVLLSP